MFLEKGGCTQHHLEIHEDPRVWWLKYGPCFHEGIDHLVDVPTEHPKQAHGYFICNIDISNNFHCVPSRPCSPKFTCNHYIMLSISPCMLAHF